jgi:hypothetical protein
MNAYKETDKNSSKNSSDISISTKDSENNSKHASDTTATLIVVTEKELSPKNFYFENKILTSINLKKNNENFTKKRNQEAKENLDKNSNKEDNCNTTAKIIKITSRYEEDINKENAENSNDKLEEYITRRNVSISENSISFEINFEKWCQKTFNKNLKEFKADAEKEKETEKELLKNGNIDQLCDYINSKDKIISEKKKNKKKKKIKNKNSNEAAEKNKNNNNSYYDKNSENAKVNSDEKENYDFVDNSNKKLNDASNDSRKLYDAEVELFKQNMLKDNKKASDIIKIKPIFSSNWLEALN